MQELQEEGCKEQKEHHSYKIGTWNVRTLKQGGKLENLKTEMQKNKVFVLGVREVRWTGQGEIRSGDYTVKTEMQKNKVFVLGVSEVRWTGQGEIRSGDYTVYYTGGECAERGVAVVEHKSIVRSVVKKIVCNDRIIAIK